MRGEVWDVQLAQIGAHPAVVLSVNALVQRLSSVTVAVITGTAGPSSTHVQLDSDAGLTGHEVSYANATDLHTIPKAKLRKRRGRLTLPELTKLEDAIRIYLGL
jgi:mRNA interferase MazF